VSRMGVEEDEGFMSLSYGTIYVNSMVRRDILY
jgi:hypothetical protein